MARADSDAERKTAKKMLRRFRRRHRFVPKTLGGDAGYEAGEFLRTIGEDFDITPQVPITAERVVAEDAGGDARRRMWRRMKTLGYRISHKAHKKVEQIFGWLKQPGGLRKVRHVGRWKIQPVAYLWGAAYNLLRMANLERQSVAA